MTSNAYQRLERDMPCAISDPSLLIPSVQATYPLGREYKGVFHQSKRCPCCAYIRFDDPPSDVLDHFYNVEYPEVSKTWYNVEGDYNASKTHERSRRVVDILNAFGIAPDAHVHEFGCAFGGTVQALKDLGYKASGTELNRTAIEQGRARGNLDIHARPAQEFLAEQPDECRAVYSYHALEHFTDPFAFLRELRQVISPDGLVISFLPNSAALFPLVYGHSHYIWYGYPEHVHLFSPGSAQALASTCGYELLYVTTAPIDIDQSGPISRALKQDTLSAQYLRNEPMDRYGEELVIVMTPAGSKLLERHQDMHLKAWEYSRIQSRRERFLMDQLATFAPNPWLE